MCISASSRKIRIMRTVNIDSCNVNFRSEEIRVCTTCDCMVLDHYSKAKDKRAIAGEKKYTPLFEGSHL